MGVRDLTVNASSVFDCHKPLIDHIRNGVVTRLRCNYMGFNRAFPPGTAPETTIAALKKDLGVKD